MKSNSTLLLAVILSAITAFAVTKLAPPPSASSSKEETAYKRVIRTGTLRCGYTSWNPLFFVDAATGEMRGIFHDLIEEVGRRLSLKIVWQEELGWGSVVEAVRTGRVDAACSGYWLNPPRIKNLSSSVAQLYTPLYIWGRQNDTQHYNSLNDLNSDQLTWVSIDGSAEKSDCLQTVPKS